MCVAHCCDCSGSLGASLSSVHQSQFSKSVPTFQNQWFRQVLKLVMPLDLILHDNFASRQYRAFDLERTWGPFLLAKRREVLQRLHEHVSLYFLYRGEIHKGSARFVFLIASGKPFAEPWFKDRRGTIQSRFHWAVVVLMLTFDNRSRWKYAKRILISLA